jgi:kynurenine 3-monooxygenase
MHGRMIHGINNGNLTQESQLYDIHGRSILAVDRGALNKRLLDELEAMPNVTFCFNHKLVGADFNRNLAWFERQEPSSSGQAKSKSNVTEVEISFDFMIGADGAHSAVRYHLMKFNRVSYQQEYIDTLWCEFHVPAAQTPSGPEFRLSPHHLHIWPGGSFMFIAIPSTDKSFTSTLFMPQAEFDALSRSPAAVVEFFHQNFPGVIPNLLSAEEASAQFNTNPHLPLISIKCTPYHFKSSVVVLGDAAHAMVPFYGQGMNAGLEDVRVLYEFLDAHPPPSSSRAAALDAYTANRHPDARAICDMAMGNYAEMSSHVRSPAYRARKWVEEMLSAWVPWLGWATQYSRVSFGNVRYSEVQAEAGRQREVLLRTSITVIGLAVGGLGVLGWKGRSVVERMLGR